MMMPMRFSLMMFDSSVRLLAGAALAAAAMSAAAAPTAAQLLGALEAADREKLLRGEIVVMARPTQETTDAGLAVSIGVIVPAAPGKTLLTLQAVSVVDDPKQRRAFAEIKGRSKGDGRHPSFAALAFAPEDAEKASQFMQAEAGDDFNFSPQELGWLRSLREQKPQGLEPLLEVLRRVLDGRYAAYRTRGLDGLAPYARAGGRQTTPGADLASATERMPVLRKGMPDFYDAFRYFPSRAAQGVRHRHFWEKKTVDGELILSLRHEMVQQRPEYALVATREYYISGELDTFQVCFALLPHQGGTLVAMADQTFTQNVTGAKRVFAVRVGRSIVEANTRPIFERLQARLGRLSN